ncbi:hypothetical protein WMY93_000594 [Mugilogobius chulae]|uniref:C2 domain-containing protein n=1 Tax=Mugilogobius chulae TaxID=88201 RepID=A0AAW0PZD6_9GOBI
MSRSQAASEELTDVLNELWRLDTNRLKPGTDYSISLQGRAGYVAQAHIDTYAHFINLLDNYEMSTGVGETVTSEELKENRLFIDAIVETEVMKCAHKYLVRKGQSPSNIMDFKKQLYEIWFRLYHRERGGGEDSCGFEHVFVGETKNHQEIMGLHNWIQFFLQEKLGHVDYKGYKARANKDTPDEDDHVLNLQFSWRGLVKPREMTSVEVKIDEYVLELIVYRHGRSIGTSFPNFSAATTGICRKGRIQQANKSTTCLVKRKESRRPEVKVLPLPNRDTEPLHAAVHEAAQYCSKHTCIHKHLARTAPFRDPQQHLHAIVIGHVQSVQTVLSVAEYMMGLFMDPEEMMKGMEENLDDPALEAELAALTGGRAAARGKAKPKGKGVFELSAETVSFAHGGHARMADECLRDIEDDDDDENVEDDEDLLAELQEVVGEDEEEVEEEEEEEESESTTSVSTPAESSEAVTPESPPAAAQHTVQQQQQKPAPVSSAAPGSVQHTLEERLSMYQTALTNAKAAGEASKVRRLERGLKSLQSMLTAVKKGRSVNEADIPPPVATGAARPPPPPAPTPPSDSSPSEGAAPGEESEPVSPLRLSHQRSALRRSSWFLNLNLQTNRKRLMNNHRKAKQKGFDAVLEALGRGETVDLSNLPPAPAPAQNAEENAAPVTDPPRRAPPPPPPAASAPAPPKDALEALEQRKAKYLEASAQAKANGDERKARMHDRIAKQYQSAIRAHKAGKPVNFDELPVPPGFPPIPGQKTPEADQGIVASLEAAHKLASADVNEAAEEEGDEPETESKPEVPKKPLLDLPAAPQKKRTPSPDRRSQKDGLSPTSAEQVEFLENRKKQFLKAALQAKQKNDMEQAKTLLRKAKGFEPMIEAARGGKPVDISQIPSPPGDEEDDFIMVHHSDVQLSEKSQEVYAQLNKILKEQYEKCMTHSKQFTHLGNVKETTKFEKMAESCKKSLELLKLSQSRGLPPPKHHFEEKAFNTAGIFPELSSTEMVVNIVKGINLPAPSGVQTNDLSAFIKFDFPYPSSVRRLNILISLFLCNYFIFNVDFVVFQENPQKHKTLYVKNTNCPEYDQSFTLTINRNHRGFRRLVSNKGLKLELFHRGGFLRSDKPIGTAVVKLEGLENQSEIREIVEVMDGRKHTGGRVEVKVRLREPLSGQDLQTNSVKWLVIDQS